MLLIVYTGKEKRATIFQKALFVRLMLFNLVVDVNCDVTFGMSYSNSIGVKCWFVAAEKYSLSAGNASASSLTKTARCGVFRLFLSRRSLAFFRSLVFCSVQVRENPLNNFFSDFILSKCRKSLTAEAIYEDSYGKSTCPKTPEESGLCFPRRLRPCPWKAKYVAGASQST
ncbi:hypothetical protein Len3610_08480 [Lentibacillus sp. CBA3610]|nr:hypothetical protein Len3610_08480 [Lentibacillus sp. CBA3610]